MPDSIFDSALLSMCMTWRHDFGLLDRKEQMAIRRELLGLYEHHVKPALEYASSAESSLAAMRQRAEEAEEALRCLYNIHARGVFSLPDEHYAAITNAAEVLSASPPADASTMGSTSEQRFIEALTPSSETKAAYIGEFSFRAHESNDVGEEFTRSFTVPWTTIKEIMKAIRKRAGIDGDHIGDATKMVGEAVPKMETTEVHPQYLPLEPEPWGGLEGDE